MPRLPMLVAGLAVLIGLPALPCTARAATLYVATTGSDFNTGLTWQRAKKTVSAALAAAAPGDEMWVAKGTYLERITLKTGVALYGGFSGNETQRADRNWRTNFTLLDGNNSGSAVTSPPGAVTTTRIDGFTIRNGTGTQSFGSLYGGGIYCSSSSPTITNNTICDNRVSGAGGGIYCVDSSSAVILNNTITRNDASASSGEGGSGIACKSSSPLIANNTIMANAGSYGGAICCYQSSPVIANNTIVANASRFGGGIYLTDSSLPTISNNIVAFNSSGIYRISSGAPILRNNCFFNPAGLNYVNVDAGVGDISVDPQFVTISYGQVHLAAGSPCIDAGHDAAVQAGWLDMDGQQRVEGARVDIGADEFGGAAPPFVPAIVRVSPSGNDANDGSSWALAKLTVQAGIDAASKQGGEVWVAEGTYNQRVTIRAWTYLYGGFSGTESTRGERDWTAHPTILDGGAGGSVVGVLPGSGMCGVDGFTIRNGSGTTSGDSRYGGGIYCSGSSMKVVNNRIVGNGITNTYGAGVYFANAFASGISNNIIQGNSAGDGGGIYCFSSSLVISNNRISANGGAGIFCAASTPEISNNVITGNGGGINCYSASPKIINNTIAGNSIDEGGGIRCLGPSDPSSPTITNNVVAFNSSGIHKNGNGTPVLRNNCVYNPTGYNYSGLNAGTGDISVDPQLLAAGYGQVQLTFSSPCIDAGDDSAVQFVWMDIDGQPRIHSTHVDMGADEFDGIDPPPFVPVVVRVSPDGDDANNGSSWVLAKKTVQAGINRAASMGGEVWVAASTYNERITLKPWTYIYGGFAGTESDRSGRNWASNPAILDGQAGGSVVSVLPGSGLCGIDGFTIRNGSGTAVGSNRYGGGIYCVTASPVIADNTIKGNTASASSQGAGGGIYSVNSSPVISNNAIIGNSVSGGSSTGGGGVYCLSATIVNNRIKGNIVTGGGGGGISCGSAVVSNNMIVGNKANTGSGISCGSATVSNNTIVANTGTGISCAGSPIISNNIVSFNSTGIIKTFSSASPTLRNNCVYNPAGANYTDLSPGTGDISVDPQLLAADFDEVHLTAASLCIDAGADAAVQPGWVDMDGEARIQGAHVDIGTDEFNGTTPPFTPPTVRVSSSGDDANDGSSWAQAKRTVQAGIDAVYVAGGGDVWVAAGTYLERITLKPRVYLYGGFTGSEGARDDRDWSGNRTILDGSAGGAVVIIPSGTGACCVDGFTIRNGAGVGINPPSSGGILCNGSSPVISNNTIVANRAQSNGGGIYCSSSTALITNNTISGNVQGGIYCTESSVRILNNRVTGNSGNVWAGIRCESSSGTISNNIVNGNSGGGISCPSGFVVTNNTVVGNSGTGLSAGFGAVANNLVAFNLAGISYPSGYVGMRNNCVYNPDVSNYVDTTLPGTNDVTLDPQLQSKEYGQVHLTAGSPCINAGDDSVVPPDGADMDGQARIHDGRVDIGADEFNGATPPFISRVVRVSSFGSDANDGSSWALAMLTVQAAIDTTFYSGGGDVWVAAGTYNECVILKPWTYMYGGFAGTEDEHDQRDWIGNVTILDGGKKGSVVSALCGHHAGAIDGFTVRNGTGTLIPGYGNVGPYGGGVFCDKSSPMITNNTITGNQANHLGDCGGGIYSNGVALTVTHNTITGNKGAGITCGSATILDNTITDNFGTGIVAGSATVSRNFIAGNTGFGIACSGTVSNNTVTGNRPGIGIPAGGGIRCAGSSAVVTNNTVTGNTGTGIGCSANQASISNNFVAGNVSSDGGGGINCSSTSALIWNNVVTANIAAFLDGGSGGGISCTSATIVNNTITWNYARRDGGGIYTTGSAAISNNIVAYNSSGISKSGGAPTLRNNCVFNPDGPNYTGLTGGPGDISVDPQLLAVDYGEVHLQLGSPCIDSGYDSAAQAGWLDWDGQPRIQGAHVDIGADEFAGTTPGFTPMVIRVSPWGNEADDGSSWEKAKRTIQGAIDEAADAGGGEIWVAADTYYERITLKLHTYIYGGFAGTETSRNQRNWTGHPTILDGGAAGSVVTAVAGSGRCGIDGFRVQHGSGTLLDGRRYGGGMYCVSSLPTLSNNIIIGNNASGGSDGYGGGVYAESAWVRLSGNTVRANGAGSAGGGIYGTYSILSLTHNTITGNVTQRGTTGGTALGGGICFLSASATVLNNVITGNSAASGGGIYCHSSSPTISHNTIATNGAGTGGGVYCSPTASPALSNNIIAFNSSGIFKTGGGPPTSHHNCVFNPSGLNYAGLTSGVGDISIDPQLLSTDFDEIHLVAGSPCIDAGDASLVQPDWVDIDGEPRIQGARVDIGADEFNGTTPAFTVPVIRVAQWGDDDNDGSSWGLAKLTVQAAIDAADEREGSEVWVAAGTYPERISLKPRAFLYGGFAGAEGNRAERNWSANATILAGGAGSSAVSAVSSGRTSAIDGFMIRNGSGTDGAIYCFYSSPSISNNTIRGNAGRGIYCFASSPLISKNVITGHTGDAVTCDYSSPTVSNNKIAGNSGGGIFCGSVGSPIIINNAIVGNSAARGVIFCYGPGSSPIISGNTMVGNSAGVYSDNLTTPLITNNVVAFNSSGVTNSGGNPTLRNNCVYNPGSSNYIGLNAGSGDMSVDPQLLAADYGEVHLKLGSPCINTGDDAAVQPGWLDMDGEPRVQGAHVDIGADEFNGANPSYVPAIVRVSPSGNDANDGASWATAKQSVQAGIDEVWMAGGDIWVAAGTYNERVILAPQAYVYGGFVGTELIRDERGLAGNATVLDGGGAGSVVSSLSGYKLSGLDGLTLRNGTGTPSSGGTLYGGGIYCPVSAPRITNNRIIGNSASSGGGIYGNPAVILNNTIAGNSAGSGGGVYCTSSAAISNNTIAWNGGNTGGGIYCSNAAPAIVNNVVAFNASGIYITGGTPTVRNNCVYNPGGANYTGVSPGTGAISLDPLLHSTDYGDVHLTAGSPCIDRGYDAAVQPGWLDMDGQARGQGPHVDIGADEFDGTTLPPFVPAVIRVGPLGEDANDGSSWELAKLTVQAGLDAASNVGGEVWVAAGTYHQRITLKPWAYIYGGFEGTEDSRDQRDWVNRTTILDGGAAGSVVSAFTGHRVSRIDGFTIENGAGTLSGNGAFGGGIYCFGSSPAIANSIILRNTASTSGGGIHCYSSSAVIANSAVLGNTAASGAGIFCDNLSSPLIINSILIGNRASISGGGLSNNNSSSPTLINCTFSGNSAPAGAGLYNASSSTPTLTNCILWGQSGPQITNSASAATLTYCDVQGGWTGTGNIQQNPLLVRNPRAGGDNIWATPDDDYGDLRPQPGSPCIDAGKNSAVPAGMNQDLGANPRFYDDPATTDTGLGSPPLVDLGAYEFVAPGYFNGDNYVDVIDLAIFEVCKTGPALRYDPTALPPGCTLTPNDQGYITPDFDKDRDVDQTDFAVFQRCYSGNQPADPNCAR